MLWVPGEGMEGWAMTVWQVAAGVALGLTVFLAGAALLVSLAATVEAMRHK